MVDFPAAEGQSTSSAAICAQNCLVCVAAFVPGSAVFSSTFCVKEVSTSGDLEV